MAPIEFLILPPLLAILGLCCILNNVSALVWRLRRGKGGIILPIIGGASLGGAMWLSPWWDTRALWWLPLLVDPGCAPMIVWVPLRLIQWRRRTWNEGA
jgi:hypothetical protein